jgi:precorrin-2 dehydrogenase/sirohydrochlorin ferrochelatase
VHFFPSCPVGENGFLRYCYRRADSKEIEKLLLVKMMNLYPVNLDIQNHLCLVVGGGGVASRKVEGLLACSARVVVISPRVNRAIAMLAERGEVEYHARSYQKGDLEGAFLVFAATDVLEVQRQVIAEAHQRGTLINVVDAPKSCTFQVPARVRRGDFLLTVSTGGGSPALAGQVRKELEEEYGLEYGLYVQLLSRIREKIVGDQNTAESHKLLFKKLLHLHILTHIEKKDWPALQEELSAVLPKDINVEELIDGLRGS